MSIHVEVQSGKPGGTNFRRSNRQFLIASDMEQLQIIWLGSLITYVISLTSELVTGIQQLSFQASGGFSQLAPCRSFSRNWLWRNERPWVIFLFEQWEWKDSANGTGRPRVALLGTAAFYKRSLLPPSQVLFCPYSLTWYLFSFRLFKIKIK